MWCSGQSGTSKVSLVLWLASTDYIRIFRQLRSEKFFSCSPNNISFQTLKQLTFTPWICHQSAMCECTLFFPVLDQMFHFLKIKLLKCSKQMARESCRSLLCHEIYYLNSWCKPEKLAEIHFFCTLWCHNWCCHFHVIFKFSNIRH